MSMLSLSAIGTPCSGPRALVAGSASSVRARASAASPVTVLNAFSFGWQVAMRSRHAVTSSVDDTLRALTRSAASVSEGHARSAGKGERWTRERARHGGTGTSVEAGARRDVSDPYAHSEETSDNRHATNGDGDRGVHTEFGAGRQY